MQKVAFARCCLIWKPIPMSLSTWPKAMGTKQRLNGSMGCSHNGAGGWASGWPNQMRRSRPCAASLFGAEYCPFWPMEPRWMRSCCRNIAERWRARPWRGQTKA